MNRRLRHWFNRSEWLTRLLDPHKTNLTKAEKQSSSRGLILLQIDGLSYTQIYQALKHRRMPFINHLIKDKNYHLRHLYSGLPSSTPAMQAELFYGVKTAVPAFSFLDRTSNEIMRMYEPHSAIRVEQTLDNNSGEALLQGGSCYADIYTGGASEAHFCPAAVGWHSTFKIPRTLAITVFIVTNAYSFLRTIMLLVIESGLAIMDCLRGIIQGRNLLKELVFIPTRVAVCILLRELTTIGVKIDIIRGLPIIHLNFLAYDEQAHRRGPTSKFAHWSLKGIDNAIARIDRAAQSANRQNYDLWIYSDHGQEETIAYEKIQGIDIKLAINKILISAISAEEYKYTDVNTNQNNESGFSTRADLYKTQPLRVQILGGKYLQKILRSKPIDHRPEELEATVTAMGPMGMIYLPDGLNSNKIDGIAKACVTEAQIPLVLAHSENKKIYAWNKNGKYILPDDSAIILGAQHPFLAEVTKDLIRLCRHPSAGDLIICGWCADSSVYYTFAIENGSHGGPGPEETHAFALLPKDIHFSTQQTYLRALHIRQAALVHLGRCHRQENYLC